MASFFKSIAALLQNDAAAKSQGDDLRIAVGALLVEAARRDDVFDAAEELAVARILRERFDLSEDETKQLLAAATQASESALELYNFTRAVLRQMDEPDRVKLIEMLWEVAYADGVLDPEEDLLIRRVAGLLYITDRERVLARQRVVARLGE